MEIAETAVFTRQVQDLLDAESYRLLQLDLTADQLKILRGVVKEEFG